MRFEDLAVDHDAIEEGTWRDAVGLTGVRLKLRGAENYAWRRLQGKLMSDLPREKQLAVSFDPKDEDEISAKLLARTCLLGWEGIEDADGKPLPFSAELAEEKLGDPRMKRFRTSVLATARILANETAAERETAAKN